MHMAEHLHQQKEVGETNASNCLGWASFDPSGLLSPFSFSRRALGPHDVSYKISYCGICYADYIWTHNIFQDTRYPIVPGHELTGIVTEIGSKVNRFKVGDSVGTGTLVNSCQSCHYCNKNMEQLCETGAIMTYNSIDQDGSVTKGGFSTHIVVHERFCVKIPENLRLEHAAPLLCAGITVYSPMVRHGMNKAGKSIGVLGLGGLGHMAVKFGKAFGCTVTVLSTSPSKKEEAIKVLGADKFVVASDIEDMKNTAKTLDFIIDTASADHPFDLYLPLLKPEGTIVVVGAAHEIKFSPVNIFLGMKNISGSITGGMKETQEMVNFCAEKGIEPMIEVIPMQYVNEALKRLHGNDVHYRFVISIKDSLHSD